jgi:benzoyl-CoA reductase/2-hydroxyglutaryl-CoA dehydratase subunit BcrC/BadD/HgdB
MSSLDCTSAAKSYQKVFGATLRERVVENGESFALAQADTPHEIFHAMDMPVLSNQWWSAYIAAKRLSATYTTVLDEHGFPKNRCSYCSLGLGCSLANDPANAPWGGLPKPALLVARLTCDCIQQVFSAWADVLETDFFALEAPAWTQTLPDWFAHANDRWDEVFQADRIDLLSTEIHALIELLERKTNRRFDQQRFVRLMLRINEQERYFVEAAEIVGAARPCPVSILDQMTNTMIPQWHRGSDWAVEHARIFRNEVRARADAGMGTGHPERIRLMWIGTGLWHDTSFYDVLAQRHGAVFVWSMYLPFAGTQYFRELRDRPLDALSSRVCSMNEVLHLPPWMNEWMVSEAKRCGIDAAVMLMPPNNRLAQSGTLLTGAALRTSGVPVLTLSADMVDAASWDRESAVRSIGDFLRRELQ